ncbi:MAG: hypothetical protein KF776_06895 [Burkholderiales bacterium]|nr:hypothetical protein [Burkholderiales bacterium]
MLGYLQILGRLLGEMPNLSREGRIRLGKTMQDQARASFDSDVSGSYAKWMGGAWLESRERSSSSAQQAHFTLSAFSEYVRSTLKQKGGGTARNSRPANRKRIVGLSDSLKKVRLIVRAAVVMADSSLNAIMNDTFSRGYVFGCHDAALQDNGISDMQRCMAEASLSYSTLWGIDDGPRILQETLALQSDPEFQRGMKAGGEDTLASLEGGKVDCYALTPYLQKSRKGTKVPARARSKAATITRSKKVGASSKTSRGKG